jgi:hypothetical protein
MFSGDDGQICREFEIGRWMTTYRNGILGEFLDLAFQGTVDMDKLDRDDGWLLHITRLYIMPYGFLPSQVDSCFQSSVNPVLLVYAHDKLRRSVRRRS